MSSYGLAAAVLLACTWTFSEAQSSSCKGRCGTAYYRGNMCQCDYSCLLYGECCRDYERLCTSKDSCRGRCGEAFRRGRKCDCDPDCVKYNHCCPDYQDHCNETEEVEGDAPVKPDSCDNNKKSTDPTPEATGQPLTLSEGTDPGDFIPTVSPTSYPNDDPGSTSKQEAEVDAPEPSPPIEGASGFESTPSDVLEDFTTGPDLDGFEIFPESQMTTATAPKDETSQSSTTVVPSSAEVTANTDADDSTNAPEPTVADLLSNEPTPESTTPRTDFQTTTVQTTPAQMDENPTSGTTAPPLPPTELPETTTLTPESKESTTPPSSQSTVEDITEATTILPTTANEETTSAPEITTPSSNPSTLAPVEESEVDTSTVKVPDETQSSTIAPTSKPNPEQPNSENPLTPVPDSDKNPEEVDASTVKVPDETQTSTIAPTSKPDPEKPSTEKPLKPVPDSDKNPEEGNTSTDKVPDVTQSSTSAPTSKPEPEKPSLVKPLIPVLDSDNKPVLNGLGDSAEYPADDSNDMDLCSGRPISGVTALSNGTVVVFRGHYFWVLDRNRVPGPAQSITQVWGIPSPIDTVFTRCNCQGKTYIFRGPQYWRYENDVLDPGFPKLVTAGFDGLRGQVTAALSVPQYRSRGESVYFFKRGGNVQKYSYQFGTNPSCDRRRVHLAVYTHRNRVARQAPAHVSLGPSINYRTSWRGFPATITAAVSIPNKREPEGYNYYVFSKSKSYKIKIEGDRPVIATAKPNASPQSNEVFKCPKKVSTSQ